ncbi:glucose-6-phosphate isomerase [Flaviramulus basaltis]|uniref:glucose-6-phosphate isomerase n=1 Tax=Flaviramulus basaltis TaxID=369401 RepID=A0A1K2IM74_9FLAO|nr:glucose-6-phosphate isomerase family protein [Flaviramulus basaltis]SFZ93556.1 glucose-6-phosphate isomerase [Flaviramulus basaltis]
MNIINHLSIIDTANTIDYSNGEIKGESLINATKYLKELPNIFEDQQSFENTDPNKIIYEVQAFLPVKEGLEGGLFFGKTIIYPGKIGDEYFMTKGHFHEKPDRGEFYWGIQGEGILLLMDKNRNTWAEKMYPGSLHYINGHIAHRTINIGESILSFGACWPSDAGHNYQEIMDNGFSARLKEIKGKPQLIPVR